MRSQLKATKKKPKAKPNKQETNAPLENNGVEPRHRKRFQQDTRALTCVPVTINDHRQAGDNKNDTEERVHWYTGSVSYAPSG